MVLILTQAAQLFLLGVEQFPDFIHANSQSDGFLTYFFKFYSGGAVDLWSCLT